VQMLISACLVSLIKQGLPGGDFVSTVVKGCVDTGLFFVSYQIQKRWVFKNK